MTGQFDRTVRTGHEQKDIPGKDSPEKNNLERTRTGQDSQNRTAMTGYPDEDNSEGRQGQDRTAKKGQQGQDSQSTTGNPRHDCHPFLRHRTAG